MTHTIDKILVSGIKPTGSIHIGNYFGAIKQFVDLQEKYQSYIFIADLHALTTLQDKDKLSSYTEEMVSSYLATGLDPEKITLFKQSDVPEVTELAWIFSCITTLPYLMRAHAFKDAQAKNKEINSGTFNYPLLMAADILIQQADIVPVGQDQKQHLEITRDVAEKFNKVFGSTFKLPKEFIIKNTESLPGIDGRKMSKSYKNTINLFASDEEIRETIMRISTDSKSVNETKDPNVCNIYQLHKFFSDKDELDDIRSRYLSGKIGYKDSKELLIKNVSDFISPLREKKYEISKNRTYIKEILDVGGKKARDRALITINSVREKVGLISK